MINVNFPACTPDQVKGVRVTRQGKRNLGFLKVDKRHDGRGNPYFWIGFERAAMMDTPAEGTDLAALAARYVSVTPLRLDRTDEAFSEALTTTLKYAVPAMDKRSRSYSSNWIALRMDACVSPKPALFSVGDTAPAFPAGTASAARGGRDIPRAGRRSRSRSRR